MCLLYVGPRGPKKKNKKKIRWTLALGEPSPALVELRPQGGALFVCGWFCLQSVTKPVPTFRIQLSVLAGYLSDLACQLSVHCNITGCNDNDNMMLVVNLAVVFVVNFAMNKMRFRVDYTRARGPSVGPFAASFCRFLGRGRVAARGLYRRRVGQ